MPQNLFLSFPTIPPAYLHHISLIPAWLCCSSKKKESINLFFVPYIKLFHFIISITFYIKNRFIHSNFPFLQIDS